MRKAWKIREIKRFWNSFILQRSDNNIVTAETEKQEKICWNSDNGQGLVFKQQTGSGSEAAECYAKRYPPRIYETYFVFGLSDGRRVRELLGQCDDTNHVIVYEPNASFLFIW